MRTKKYTPEELRQHRAEYMKKYQARRKEELAEYQKEYWKKNKESISKKRRETKSQTKYQRKWYDEHRDEWNAYIKQRRNKLKAKETNNE